MEGSAEQSLVEPPAKAPIVVGSLPEDLRRWLLSSLPGDEQGLKDAGFESCVDHPQRPQHRYVEGYFHALPGAHDRTVASVHPRQGAQLSRPPAPPPLAAFCEAWRRANAPLWSAMERDLRQSPAAAPLARVLRRRAHFADLSAQIHWGEEVPEADVAWHVDAPNSFLHLALGLQGRRALHAATTRGEREVHWQEQGAAYLSTPCCFPHAVEYPSAEWEGRVVAVQCRLLLSEDELFGTGSPSHGPLDTDPLGRTAAVVWGHLTAAGRFAMPSMCDVTDVMAEMQGASPPGDEPARGRSAPCGLM